MWTAYLFQTVNGQVGPHFEFSDLKWSISLNETESFSLVLSKTSLPNLDLKYWLDPWWAGVVVCWNGKPIVAGPITQRPTESFTEISLECMGIRAILARRLIIDEQSDWNQLSKKKVSFKNMSLGNIAKEVVKTGLDKPAGGLPIVYPVVDPDATKGSHERNYQSFNLSNIFVDDVLTKLSEVSNGPDVMFRPKFVTDNKLAFEMWYGTEDDPRIPQQSDIVFDTTAQYHDISDLRIVVTGAYQTHRVFAVGAGQDEGTLIRMAQDQGPNLLGYPILESVYSSGQVENGNVVSSHARGNLLQNRKNLLEISMKVSAEGAYPLGTYQVGDVVSLITSGWVSIPQGIVKARILNINGDGSTGVSLSLQTED